MHLSVIDIYVNVSGIRTGKRALCHLLHNSLKDCRHKARINCTSYNTVEILEFSAPIQVILLFTLNVKNYLLAVNLKFVLLRSALYIRLYKKVNLSKLTCAARLLLVAVVCNCNLGNGLSVRNLWSKKLYLQLGLVIDNPLENIYMVLSHTAKDSLF